jgi:hypothetical protein
MIGGEQLITRKKTASSYSFWISSESTDCLNNQFATFLNEFDQEIGLSFIVTGIKQQEPIYKPI